MKTVCNKLEDCKVEVKVEFEQKEWKDAQDEVVKRLSQRVQIDGFRKGHVPTKILKAKIGEQAILGDALDLLLNRNYSGILSDNDVEPVAQPEVKVETMTANELTITVIATVAPEVKLGQYKELEVKKSAVKVTKKEIEEEIKNYQNQFAELVIKDGAVENGDTVVIDFEGFKNGEKFEGGSAENHELEIGSGAFIPGFEDQIIGMTAGEEKDIDVTFPTDYQAEELAGQPVVFHVKLHEAKRKVLPEADDELAKDINIDGIETLEDLQTYTKEQIRNRKDRESEQKFTNDLYDALIAATPFDVPEAMIDTETDYMLKEVEQNLSYQGITLELFQQFTGKSADDMRAEMKEEAEKRVKVNLILKEIVKAENIEASQEDIDAEYEEISKYYGYEVDKTKELLGNREEQLIEEIVIRKASQFVKDNVK